MSTAHPPLPAAPPRRPLTPEASNLLAWWWLAIGFTVMLIVAMWPSIFPDTDGGSTIPNYLAFLLCAGLVGVGVWATMGFVQARRESARIMRMTAIIGLGVGVAGVILFAYGVMFAPAGPEQASFFGAAPVASALLWIVLIVTPFILGLTVIFGLISDGVEEWFNPPPEPVTRKEKPLQVDPATAALMAGGTAASLRASGEEAVMTEVTEAMARSRPGTATGDDLSVEVIGDVKDDLSVEVIGGKTEEQGTYEELAALEQALSEDVHKKKKGTHEGDEPLSVDEDMKL